MKTVTVEQVQSGFPDLLRLVARGEELRVVRKKRTVARIVPVHRKSGKVDWADTWAGVDAIFGGKPAPGKPGSEIIKEGRR
jgi:antitoxin (DNA-binding transcriptional repressor) of toxin-antitoxin stability system